MRADCSGVSATAGLLAGFRTEAILASVDENAVSSATSDFRRPEGSGRRWRLPPAALD
jgi:hypothetical protein